MSSSNVRAFTPPTCTLKIDYSAQKTNKPYFQLSFDDPRIPEAQQITIKGDRQQLEQLCQVVFLRLQTYLSSSFLPSSTADNNSKEIELNMQSLGLVNHELSVNFSDSDSAKIELTTVQLFDLVTALEAYITDVNSPPAQQPKSRRNMLIWGSCAVAVVIVSGLATLAIRSRQLETQSASSPTNPTATIPEYQEVVPPQKSKPEAPVTTPQLNEPISSAKKLPPPLPVDAPKPQPNIPDPADYPPAKPLDLSKLEPPSYPPDPKSSNIAVIPETDIKPQPSTDTQIKTESPSNSNRIDIPQPVPNPAKTNAESNSQSLVEPGFNDVNKQRSLDNNFNTNNSLEIAPEAKITAIASNSDRTQNNNSDVALSTSSQSQLQQVNKYFQERWQPPKQLNETLEYRLIINNNGAIARIFPIGKASQIYLDRTNIPLMGETFIDPVSESQNLTVRLMLSPDGEVNTFAE